MTTITSTRSTTAAGLSAILTPRDDVVIAERIESADATTTVFVQSVGPFARYRRVVVVDRSDHDRPMLTESTVARLGVTYWWPLIGLLTRAALRRPRADEAHPWWSPPCRVDLRSAQTLGCALTLAVAAGFLGGIVGQTLTYIGRDLGADVAGQAVILSLLRIGAVLTTIGMVAADRIGRRRVILASLLVAVAANLVTAVAPGLAILTVAQTIGRGIVAVAALTLPLLVIEELPAGARAWAIGLLFLAGGLGVGMVLWVLPLLDLGVGWWRFPFALSLLAVPVIVRAGRRLPESRRYTSERIDHSRGSRGRPGISARRLVLLAVVLIAVNLFISPVAQLQNEYLRAERGFSASTLTAFLLLTNTWAAVTVFYAGRVADRRSRRLVAPIGLLGLTAGNVWMFATSGWQMWLASFVGSFVGAATIPSLGVLSPELFPTGRRGAANGLLNGLAIGGSVVGLLAAGAAIRRWGYGPTFAVLGIFPVAVIPLLRLLPDSARVELEDLNPLTDRG